MVADCKDNCIGHLIISFVLFKEMLSWPENDGNGLHKSQCIDVKNPTFSLGNKHWATLDCMVAAHFKLAYSFIPQDT